MGSLNKILLIGNVGREPEIRYTPAGVPVARFSLATSERWRSRETGEQQDRTEWHNIVAFGRLAEQVKEYVAKGRQLFVDGRLRTTNWTDVNGIKHTRTEIFADRIIFLGRREGEQAERGIAPSVGIEVDEDFTLDDLGPAVEMDDLSLTPGD